MTMTDIETEKVVTAFFKDRSGDLPTIIATLHLELTERIAMLEQQVRELQARKR